MAASSEQEGSHRRESVCGRRGGPVREEVRGHLIHTDLLSAGAVSEQPTLLHRSLAMRREAYTDWFVREVETPEGRKEIFGPPLLAGV